MPAGGIDGGGGWGRMMFGAAGAGAPRNGPPAVPFGGQQSAGMMNSFGPWLRQRLKSPGRSSGQRSWKMPQPLVANNSAATAPPNPNRDIADPFLPVT